MKLTERLDRIEEILQEKDKVPLIAIDDGKSIEWNGQTYANEAELGRAFNAIAGHGDAPLVIIKIGKADSWKNNAIA